MVGLGALYIAETCGRGAGIDGGTVNGESRGWLAGGQHLAITDEEGIDGVDAVDRRVPCLGALLLQQPATHLVDGLLVLRCYQLDSLDGSHLGRYLVVVP